MQPESLRGRTWRVEVVLIGLTVSSASFVRALEARLMRHALEDVDGVVAVAHNEGFLDAQLSLLTETFRNDGRWRICCRRKQSAEQQRAADEDHRRIPRSSKYWGCVGGVNRPGWTIGSCSEHEEDLLPFWVLPLSLSLPTIQTSSSVASSEHFHGQVRNVTYS